MSPAVLVQLARTLQAERPDLTNAQRADLAVRIAKADGALIDRDGNLHIRDDARAMINEGKPADAPRTPKAPTRCLPTPADLTSSLAGVPDGPKAQAQRAAIRERHARAVLGDSYQPTKEKP
jgi:hypothetical protein